MTEPSIKMGRYIAIMSTPNNTPSLDMISGSIRELKLSMALLTAAYEWTATLLSISSSKPDSSPIPVICNSIEGNKRIVRIDNARQVPVVTSSLMVRIALQ